MRKKLKPEQDLEAVQSDLIETVCYNYKNGVSVRALAKQMELSPMKTRKILITGGCYSTDLSTEIEELYKEGKTVSEIAEMLNTTPANVNSYLPYERIIYNMSERSIEADRQARYRERIRSGVKDDKKKPGKRTVERKRDKTMVIVVGQKLRKMLPAGIYDSSSDPLARDKSYTWGGYENGEFVIHEAPDPDRMIWCAEMTSSGRGKGKKSGIVLMSANCGFAVICPIPKYSPSEPARPTETVEYRDRLEKLMLDTIRNGFLAFALPEERVLDYTDTVRRIELVKGRRSTPGVRLEQLIEQELKWDKGMDPVERFNVRGNWTDRKFGNGDYRRVEKAVFNMLGMNEVEQHSWQERFLSSLRVGMSGK